MIRLSELFNSVFQFTPTKELIGAILFHSGAHDCVTCKNPNLVRY